MTAKTASSELRRFANAKARKVAQSFFKTGPGEYGEGDVFLGVKVPHSRQVAKKYQDLPLPEVQKLLKSKVHEERFLALIILVMKFKKASAAEQKIIYQFYVRHFAFVNNWDLIDTTAEHIVGAYLWDQNRQILDKWARSCNLWHRRIAMLSTFYFIRRSDFEDTLRLAKVLLHDEHDLIHKAVGWLLREVGKRELRVLLDFLDLHASEMPRTMLRYAIEKLTPRERKHYLGLKEKNLRIG